MSVSDNIIQSTLKKFLIDIIDKMSQKPKTSMKRKANDGVTIAQSKKLKHEEQWLVVIKITKI